MSENTKVDWPEGNWQAVCSGTVQKGDRVLHIYDANFVEPDHKEIGETIFDFHMVIRDVTVNGNPTMNDQSHQARPVRQWRIYCVEKSTGYERSFVVNGDRSVAEWHFLNTKVTSDRTPDGWVPRLILPNA